MDETREQVALRVGTGLGFPVSSVRGRAAPQGPSVRLTRVMGPEQDSNTEQRAVGARSHHLQVTGLWTWNRRGFREK